MGLDHLGCRDGFGQLEGVVRSCNGFVMRDTGEA